MADEVVTPIPADLETEGLSLDQLLELAHEKGYSMDALVARSGVGRQPDGGVVGNLSQPS